MKIKIDISIKASKIVKTFILAHVIILSGWGFVSPIFSVFILDNIEGATLATAGIAVFVYFVIKAITQIPIANFLDKTKGEKDDLYAAIIGLFLAGFVAFSFILITETWQLYLTQVFQAIAFSLYIPAWLGMFSRHHDKGHDSLDWALQNAAAGLGMGITAALGGMLANTFGFDIVFILVGIFSFLSALVLFSVPKLIFPKTAKKQRTITTEHNFPHHI